MKLLAVLFSFALVINPVKIRQINSAKEKAAEAFSKKDYKTTITNCTFLVDSLEMKDDPIILNLAHAYFLSNDTANALTTYESLTASMNKKIRSKAHQQIGVIKNLKGDELGALEEFKYAIQADSDNKDARYNYELLKKYVLYPETVLKKFQLLVSNRKYKEAKNFLTGKMKQSRRVQQFKDYKDRIQIVITIDSLAQL